MAQLTKWSVIMAVLVVGSAVCHVISFADSYWYSGRNGSVGLWKVCIESVCSSDMSLRPGNHNNNSKF